MGWSLLEAFNALPEDESELRARKNRAERAAALLNDPMLRGAIQACRDRIVGNFLEAKASDTDALREQRLLYAALDMIVGALREHIGEGKIADAALRQIERRRLLGGRA